MLAEFRSSRPLLRFAPVRGDRWSACRLEGCSSQYRPGAVEAMCRFVGPPVFGDDLVAHVARRRAAHLSVVEGLDGVERQRAVLDARQVGPSGDSAVWRCRRYAVRDLQPSPCRVWRRGGPVTEVDASASFLREQLAAVGRQRVSLDQRRARLAEALRVLERDALPAAGGRALASATPSDEAAPFSARILGVLRRSGPLARAQLVANFASAVKPSTVDSSAHRLQARGLVKKVGSRFVLAESSVSDSPTDGDGVAPQSLASLPDRSSGVVDAALGEAEADTHAQVGVGARSERRGPSGPTARVSDPDDEVPPKISLRARVHEAVLTGVAGTRKSLHELFAAQGVRASQVDSAVSGLTRLGKVRCVGRGVVVAVDPAPPSGTAAAGSPA